MNALVAAALNGLYSYSMRGLTQRFWMTATALLVSVQVFAQPQANNWMFGDSAWLNFSDGTPMSLNGSNLFTTKGCAAVSDSSGNLVFYSDGFHLWNKNHQLAVNGDSLWTNEFAYFSFDSAGNPIAYHYWNNASNSLVILPDFALERYKLLGTSTHLTSTLFPPNGTDPGIVYNDVFVHGDTTEVLLPKNQFLLKDSFGVTGFRDGRLCAIRHANGRDWWIVNKRLLNDSFAVFLFDPLGFHGPYYQTIGLEWSDWAGSGELAVSPQGDKICYANTNGQIDLYGFDRCTGQFTSYLELGSPPYDQNTNLTKQFYGASFSPSGERLYVNVLRYLYQYDLTAPDVTASKTTVYTVTPFTFNINQEDTFSHGLSEMELAPDGKIYFGLNLCWVFPREINSAHNHYLSVINDPDALGTACNVQIDAVNLGNARVLSGLPNNPNYALGKIPGSPCDTLNPPLASFASTQPSVCLGGCVPFTNQTTAQNSSATAYQWLFPGGTPSSSNDTAPSICYNQAGAYDVTLVATNAFGSDTVTLSNYITVFAGVTSIIVYEANDTLFTVVPFSHYQWFKDGVSATLSTDSFCLYAGNGTYHVIVTDENGCTGEASYIVNDVVGVSSPSFVVSPNPSSDEFVCRWSGMNVSAVELYDAFGRKLAQQTPHNHQAVVNVSGLSPGVYFLKVVSQNGDALVVKASVVR